MLEDELEGVALLRTTLEEQQLLIEEQQAAIQTLSDKLLLMEVLVEKLQTTTTSSTRGKIPTTSTPAAVETNHHSLVLKDEILLKQNYPNPFKNMTTIEYYVPLGTENSVITISTMEGKDLGSVKIEKAGYGTVDIHIEDQSYLSGVLLYTLFVDGEIYETKKMTLVR